MKILRHFHLGLLSALLGSAPAAFAIPVHAEIAFNFYNFTATAPQGMVPGKIGVTLESTTGKLLSLTSVDLQIYAHTYSLEELTFGEEWDGQYIEGYSAPLFIGGLPDSFSLRLGGGEWNQPPSFGYSTSSTFGGYMANRYNYLTITQLGPVVPPEEAGTGGTSSPGVPDRGATASLLLLALAGVAAARGRR